VTRRIRLEPEAEDEIFEAASHYNEKVAGLGDRFVAAAGATQQRLQRWPNAGSLVDVVDSSLGVRRVPMVGFPYRVVYMSFGRDIHVIAVVYDGRQPGYWADRVPK